MKAPLDIPVSSSDWSGIMSSAGGDLRRLDHVIRFSSVPYSVPESVSAHSFWVCLYAALIHRRLMGTQEPRLDLAVTLHALTHDLPECLTGDVVRTFKYASKDLKRAVDVTETAMFEERMTTEVKSLVASIGDAVPPDDMKYVRTVVKAVDFMSLFQYMNREWNRGNLEMRPFVKRMRVDLMAEAIKLKVGVWYEESLSHLYISMADSAMSEPPERTA